MLDCRTDALFDPLLSAMFDVLESCGPQAASPFERVTY